MLLCVRVCARVPAKTPRSLEWWWKIQRSDGSWFRVQLLQYTEAKHANLGQFKQLFGIKKSWSTAPSLKRVCVLSAPVAGKPDADGTPGPSTNDALNASINEALQWTKTNMQSKGFLPEKDHEVSAASLAAYKKYFDM